MSFWRAAGERWQNGRTGSGGVFPREPAEAREWAERYLTVAEVETGFAGAIQHA